VQPVLASTTRCPNCNAALHPEPAPLYCWHCGQETQLHEPTFLEFVHAFIGHYVVFDGALWRTLRLLLLSPGRLTAEYFVGRRRRYVLPLRLYLSASFVFFLVVKVFGSVSSFQLQVAPAIDSHGRPITAAGNPAEYASIAEMRGCVEKKGSCSWARTRSAEVGLQAASLSEHPDELSHRLLGLAPYVVFVLLPLFAAIVMLAYRSRGLPYGAHFVFSLHTHAFWFLWLTCSRCCRRSPPASASSCCLSTRCCRVAACTTGRGGRRLHAASSSPCSTAPPSWPPCSRSGSARCWRAENRGVRPIRARRCRS